MGECGYLVVMLLSYTGVKGAVAEDDVAGIGGEEEDVGVFKTRKCPSYSRKSSRHWRFRAIEVRFNNSTPSPQQGLYGQ